MTQSDKPETDADVEIVPVEDENFEDLTFKVEMFEFEEGNDEGMPPGFFFHFIVDSDSESEFVNLIGPYESISDAEAAATEMLTDAIQNLIKADLIEPKKDNE